MKRYLEAGQIVNTHGVRGEVKLMPWCDGPGFILGLSSLLLDEAETKIERAREHKGAVILKLAGIDDLRAAMALRNKIVFIDRERVALPEGHHFVQDLIGLPVIEEGTGRRIGTLGDILPNPANEIYIVRRESGPDIMIPNVRAFVRRVDPAAGRIEVALIEGME